MTAVEPKISLSSGDALIIVDVQNDFLPGGSLAVSGGDQIIPVLNDYIGTFDRLQLPIFATRDWHPPDHCSFQAQGGPWPPHCVAHRSGASFPAGLQLPVHVRVISKAESPGTDAYSGFEGTDLDALLRGLGATRLFIGGLATDYCVLNTVKDALARQYRVYVLEDAIRAVNVEAGDGERARAEMRERGALAITRQVLLTD